MSLRSYRAASWLGAATLLWAILAVIARVPTREAVTVTNVLFVVTLLFTYVAVLAATVHASATPRPAAMRAAALTLGLLATLAILELSAAARIVHWELVFGFLRGEREQYVADPDVGFRHVPNARRSGPLRSDIEVAWGLPASRTDSYVEGHYVSDDQVVSRLLEARLGRPVANLGVAGYGTAQELVVLERDAMPLAPKVVIWFFFEWNDLYNDHAFENALLAPRELRASPWTPQHRWWRRSFVRNAHAQLRLLLYPLVRTYCPDFAVMKDGPHRGQKILFWPEAAVPWTGFERNRWERAQQILGQAATLTRERDVRLLLVYVPIKFRVYRDFVDVASGAPLRDWTLWPLPDLFADFCRGERLACLDLTGVLREAVRAGGMPHAPADSHWSAEGHQLIAERLADMLASLGWVRGTREGGTL